MKEFLAPARYVDSDHPAVISFSEKNSPGKNNQERAISLYYAVRDGIRYNPFLDFSKEETFQASQCIVAGEGFCIGKAALLAACARAAGIPARVGFADVKNHLTTPALRERWRGTVAGDIAMPGTNHFSVLDGLAAPASPLFAGARRLMQLDR